MTFPTSLDSFTNVSGNEFLNFPSPGGHAGVENLQNAALAAIEGYVGVTGGTAVTGQTVSYGLFSTSSINPGHNHTLDSLLGKLSLTTQVSGVLPVSAGGTGTSTGPISVYTFKYGEALSTGQYVFQSSGNEFILMTDPVTGGQYNVTGNSVFVGDLFTVSDPRISNIRQVNFNLAKGGSPSGPITAQIFNVSGGLPTGTALGTTQSIAASALSGSTSPFNSVVFPFSTPLNIVGTGTYASVLNVASVTGLNGSGTDIIVQTNSSETPKLLSLNSGGTWSAPSGGGMYSNVFGGITTSYVYRTDILTPIYDMGPYKGMVTASGVSGYTGIIQTDNISPSPVGGLTPTQNMFIDPNVIGGLTQTVSASSGRAVGVAVDSTNIQLSVMRKRGAGQAFTSGSTINQDGTLILITETASAGSYTITESNPVSSNVIAEGTGNGASPIMTATVPVRAGYTYTVFSTDSITSLTFYPTING